VRVVERLSYPRRDGDEKNGCNGVGDECSSPLRNEARRALRSAFHLSFPSFDSFMAKSADGSRYERIWRWETYEMTIATTEKTPRMAQRPMPETNDWRTASRSSRRPEERTALPRAMPPMARKTMDQWKLIVRQGKKGKGRKGLALRIGATVKRKKTKEGDVLVEILLGQDARPKERHQRDDGDDAHVAHPALERLFGAPKADGEEGDGEDEDVGAGELAARGFDGRDDEVAVPAVAEVKEGPDLDSGGGRRRSSAEREWVVGRRLWEDD
jgi:hypothetical protein